MGAECNKCLSDIIEPIEGCRVCRLEDDREILIKALEFYATCSYDNFISLTSTAEEPWTADVLEDGGDTAISALAKIRSEG